MVGAEGRLLESDDRTVGQDELMLLGNKTLHPENATPDQDENSEYHRDHNQSLQEHSGKLSARLTDARENVPPASCRDSADSETG